MSLTIHRFLEGKAFDEGNVRRFLSAHSFPIVENDSLTFVFYGDADGVYLQHFIYGLPTSRPFQRVNGSQFWYLVLEIPERSRIQYKFNVVRGADHQWILDPFNPARAFDPFGANSVCHSRGTERPDWTFHDPEARPGEISEISLWSEAFHHERRVRVYLPARFRRTRRYPLLVVHDGSDYLRFSSLKVVLDNLIHRLEIPPMIVALTDAGERLREYPDHPPHARFLAEELLPRLENDYPLRDEPAARGLMGASFGGVAALSCAWRYQGVFGRLLLQSGSFAFTDIGTNQRGPTFEPVVKFVNAFRETPGRPAERVFISCGTYESLIYENRSLVPVLQKAGMDVRFVEARDGHNWENWRDRLREGLSWLFPGPLWMVYE
ncbi:MAG: esterase family protein [Thermoanaerobaculia bacterium]|nr:esterase family protein [Thermoanaerobaculia bacterium]